MKVKYVVLISLGLLMGQAQGKTLSEAVKECGQVQNSLKRLVCYDKVVNDMNKFDDLDALMNVPAPLPPRGTSDTAKAAAPKVDAKQDQDVSKFGLKETTKSEIVGDKMYITVLRVELDPYKKAVFTLDGNQVWKQVDSRRVKIEENQRVYIESGLLGSYYLSTDDINTRIKVKRVK